MLLLPQPAYTVINVFLLLFFKAIFAEEFRHHFNAEKSILLIKLSIILHLLQEEIESIITVFTAIFCLFKKGKNEGFLSGEIVDGFYRKILDKFKSLLIIQTSFENFSVDCIEALNCDYLAEKADNFMYDDYFRFMPVACNSK